MIWEVNGYNSQYDLSSTIRYNKGTYIHVAGNGVHADSRSNAHTLDWEGNAWFAGDVYIDSTSGTNKDNGSKKLATEEYVNEQLAGVEENVQPDWNQNDETAPDYVKNRTHYKDIGDVVLIPETSTTVKDYGEVRLYEKDIEGLIIEKLIIGETVIDLKLINGSTNEYVPEDKTVIIHGKNAVKIAGGHL